MKGKVKPFTLLLILIVIAFLVFWPDIVIKRITDKDIVEETEETKDYRGIIDVWDISYINSGTGNHKKWLDEYIGSFEKENPGVYINYRTLTVERLNLYLYAEPDSDFLPDIVSLDPYRKYINEDSLMDLSSYFADEELEALHPAARECVVSDNGLHGVPWMLGVYCYIFNLSLMQENNQQLGDYLQDGILTLDGLNDLVNNMSFEKKVGRKVVNYYGFNTFYHDSSYPVISMFYEDGGTILNNRAYNMLMDWSRNKGLVHEKLLSLPYADSLSLFVNDRRATVMLGGSNIIYTLRRLQSQGKGFEFAIHPVINENGYGLYTDQIAAFGLHNSIDSLDKEEICVLFLKGMLEEEHQRKLTNIGMFPVIKDINNLYEDDEAMTILEKSLADYSMGPTESRREKVLNILDSLKGEQEIKQN